MFYVLEYALEFKLILSSASNQHVLQKATVDDQLHQVSWKIQACLSYSFQQDIMNQN